MTFTSVTTSLDGVGTQRRVMGRFGVLFAAIAGLFHYTRVGPNEVSKEEEAEALAAAKQLQGEKHEA